MDNFCRKFFELYQTVDLMRGSPQCAGCFMAKCHILIKYIRQTKVFRLNYTIDF